MILDITEYKFAENALKEKERLLRESQAAGNIASYSTDLVNKTWNASDEIYKIFGIDKNHPQTLQAWINCIHPDFRDNLVNDLFNSNAIQLTMNMNIRFFVLATEKRPGCMD